eukprot:73403_1
MQNVYKIMKFINEISNTSNTTKSSNNYSPIRATNTLDSGKPTPNIKTQTNNASSPDGTANIIDNNSDSSYDDKLDGGNNTATNSSGNDTSNSNEPDPLAETQSFANPNIGTTNNTQIQYSPS